LDVYSLWLRPTGSGRRRLRLLIARLAGRCRTVSFDPHVTLLGGIVLSRGRAVEKTSTVARGVDPFPVRLAGLGHEAAYFRCLYLKAGGAGLSSARAAAVRAFEEESGRRASRRTGGRFRPHLSLVYGRLPAAGRRKLVLEIEGSLGFSFMARHIALVRTGGAPRYWRVIAVRRLR